MLDRKIPIMKMAIFKPGKVIKYQGNTYTVEHVNIDGYKLTVKFKESTMLYDADTIPCEPDILDFNRK